MQIERNLKKKEPRFTVTVGTVHVTYHRSL